MAFIPDKQETVSKGFKPDVSGPVKPTVSIKDERQNAEVANMGFIERLKAGFGDDAYKSKLVEPKGFLKGGVKEFAGDMADMAGGSLPFIGGWIGGGAGSVVGGVGAIPGAAIGATAGESVKQTIGQLLGVRGNTTNKEELKDSIKEGVFTLVGGKIIKTGGDYVVSRIPKLLGFVTGDSPEAIVSAFKNPEAANKAFQNGDKAMTDIVNQGAKKSIEIRDSFFKAYHTAFDKIAGAYGNRTVSKETIFDKFTEILKSKGVTFGQNGLPDYSTSKIVANPGEIGKINQAIESMHNWEKNGNEWSMKGVVRLKQLIGELTKFSGEGGKTSKSPALGELYHRIDEEIRKTLPTSAKKAYAELNENFSKNKDLFDDMVTTFNSGDPFKRLGQLYSKNNIALRNIINAFEEKSGLSVQGTVSGKMISDTKATIDPRTWLNILLPSQLKGKIITIPGQIKREIADPLVDKVLSTGRTLDELMTR
jgi:hypothetical protein